MVVKVGELTETISTHSLYAMQWKRKSSGVKKCDFYFFKSWVAFLLLKIEVRGVVWLIVYGKCTKQSFIDICTVFTVKIVKVESKEEKVREKLGNGFVWLYHYQLNSFYASIHLHFYTLI